MIGKNKECPSSSSLSVFEKRIRPDDTASEDDHQNSFSMKKIKTHSNSELLATIPSSSTKFLPETQSKSLLSQNKTIPQSTFNYQPNSSTPQFYLKTELQNSNHCASNQDNQKGKTESIKENDDWSGTDETSCVRKDASKSLSIIIMNTMELYLILLNLFRIL